MTHHKKANLFFFLFLISYLGTATVHAQDNSSPPNIFDDKYLIDGYTQRYTKEPFRVLLAMLRDDTLTAVKTTAAIQVLTDNYSDQLFARDKAITEKSLLRRLNKTDSPFVQIAAMRALCRLNRYQYFKPMVPELILKIDHYDRAVSQLATDAVNDILTHGKDKAWEARIVFTTLRKLLFLSRNKLTDSNEKNGPAMREKIKILRWSIKILGTEELRQLPKEVIPLL